MSGSEIEVVQGVITDLDGHAYDLHLGVRDRDGRNLVIKYSWRPETGVRERIQNALAKGMTVSVQVEGPVTPSKDTYQGKGIITTLAQPKA